MPTLTHRHKNARFWSTSTTGELVTADAMNVATTSKAAAANHFSCSRSSPADRANLTVSATTLTSSAASKTIPTGRLRELPGGLKGRDQPSVATTSAAIAIRTKLPPTDQATGRHLADRSCPVGKRRNRKLSTAKGITQTQLASHMPARAAGSDPGAAISARSP